MNQDIKDISEQFVKIAKTQGFTPVVKFSKFEDGSELLTVFSKEKSQRKDESGKVDKVERNFPRFWANYRPQTEVYPGLLMINGQVL